VRLNTLRDWGNRGEGEGAREMEMKESQVFCRTPNSFQEEEGGLMGDQIWEPPAFYMRLAAILCNG